MAQTFKILNGISILEVEEVVIGSQFTLAVQFEEVISVDPDVFEPIDFTTLTLKADLKLSPAKEVEADAEFTCIPRGEDGWVDFSLDGEVTGALLPKKYYSSVKVWPTSNPEKGDTFLVIVLPMVYKATR